MFKLRQYKKIENVDGIVYIHTYWNSYILDNTNLLGETLGVRRKSITSDNVYPFKSAIKTPRQLVLNAKTSDTYCDNTGRIFKYKKSKNCVVKCFKVANITQTGGKLIISLVNFPVCFVVPLLVKNPKYVTVVHFGQYYILYSIENTFIKQFKVRL